MGYTLGGLIVGADFTERFKELLARVRPGRYEALGDVSLADATMPQFTDAAVGVINGKTLVLHQFWFFDCSFDAGGMGPLDRRLMELSREAPVLCFVFDETSMSFGFAYFESGARVRARRSDPEGVHSDYGTPLPAEGGLDPEVTDDERIWTLTESMLGERLDRLVFEDATLTRYAER
jgi:hypothetical protein